MSPCPVCWALVEQARPGFLCAKSSRLLCARTLLIWAMISRECSRPCSICCSSFAAFARSMSARSMSSLSRPHFFHPKVGGSITVAPRSDPNSDPEKVTFSTKWLRSCKAYRMITDDLTSSLDPRCILHNTRARDFYAASHVKINPFFLKFETICMLKYRVVRLRDPCHDLTN
jgi:hypothetical protein